MKSNNLIFYLIAIILVIVAITGTLEPKAFGFVSAVSKKNIDFLALLAEIKTVMAGLSKLSVPFINGHAGSVDTALDKAQSYLLFTNAISFVQLMILGISKSLLFKIALLVLLGVSIVRGVHSTMTKVLVLALALSPGLMIFSIGVQQISKVAAIDFGDAYLKTLEAKVKVIKTEKANLMQQHALDVNRINNGAHGIVFFKKLKEDVSYDFRRAGADIKGASANIRLLIHHGGHEIVSKLLIFGTMILFSLMILPGGYVLVVYTIYKSQFGALSVKEEARLGISGLVRIWDRVTIAVKQEVDDIRDKVDKAEADINRSVTNAAHDIEAIPGEIKTDILEDVTRTKDKIEGIATHAKLDVDHTVSKVGDKARSVGHSVDQDVHKVEAFPSDVHEDVAELATKSRDELVQDIQGLQARVDALSAHVKTNVDKVRVDLGNVSETVVGDIHHDKHEVHSKIQNVGDVAYRVSENIHDIGSKVVQRTEHTAHDLKADAHLVGEEPKELGHEIESGADEIKTNVVHNVDQGVQQVSQSVTSKITEVETTARQAELKAAERVRLLDEQAKGIIDDPNLL